MVFAPAPTSPKLYSLDLKTLSPSLAGNRTSPRISKTRQNLVRACSKSPSEKTSHDESGGDVTTSVLRNLLP